MRYAYFPGCSMGSTAKSYRLATEFVCDRIGMRLVEIEDWNCCGATSGHVKDEVLGLALPARTLALAERQEPELDVVTGCAACYGRLKNAAYRARTDSAARFKIEKTIELPYGAKREVLNFLDIFSTPEALEAVRGAVTRPLTGLRVACYYGCLNVRPAEVTGAADRENPMSMDRIVALSGAEPVEWSFKTECCGAAHQNDAPKEARPLVVPILRNAQAAGAQAIAVACPLCHMNLEMRQREYRRKYGLPYIPVFSFAELLAVAMRASAGRLALESHYVPACKVLADVLRAQEGGEAT